MSNFSKNSIASSGRMVFCPFGLLISEAILAINLLYEIPAEARKPVLLKIFVLISLAIIEADGFPFLFIVTSKYASSKERGSTKSVYS